MITLRRLKELFRYDAETGNFIRVLAQPGQSVGSAAGTIGDRGYRVIKIDGKSYKAHRLAWLYVSGWLPALDIDHINGDTSDNRIVNLREATKEQNLANCRRYKSNSSGLKGVCWHKASGKWSSYIQARGKRKHLGLYNSPIEAHHAFLEAAKELHGEFARAA